MIVDKINAFLTDSGKTLDEVVLADVAILARHSFQRQFGIREEHPITMRLSSLGKCMRQQAYRLLGFEENGKEIDARAKMVFFMGDLTELAIVQLARAAGCNITDFGMNQKTVEIEGIQGHPDGIIDGDTLLEVKSMSSFSFQAFQDQQIDEGYRYQCNAYMHALGLSQTCIVGLNKDAGVLHEWIINKDQTIVDDIIRRIGELRAVTRDSLPRQPYSPNEKGFLPWQCLYCGFWKTCRPNAERVVVSGKYRLREPNSTDVRKKENENTSDASYVRSAQ